MAGTFKVNALASQARLIANPFSPRERVFVLLGTKRRITTRFRSARRTIVELFIGRKEPSNNSPIIAALVAGIVTLAVVLAVAFVKAPEQLSAAFALPQLVTLTPTPLGVVEPSVTPTSTATRRPTATRTPTPTPTPMATVAPSPTPYPVVEHFVLGRPVGLTASGISPDRAYLYGTTGRGEYEVHHGEEFVNPLGTEVVAVGDATVVVAGRDELPLCGELGNELCGRKPDYYGNVIILRLDRPYKGRPLFAVYGHLSEVLVKVGQQVREGEVIGRVGQTGIAIGPHLHFEVRYGVNSYSETRNPILWMSPLPGTGALAGRLQDRFGNPIRNASIILYADNEEGTYLGDTETYARDRFPPVNPDEVMGENWALGDLPAGSYVVRAIFGGMVYSRRVTVAPGALTFIVFGG